MPAVRAVSTAGQGGRGQAWARGDAVLIDRPEISATGSGEPACNPVPAAIANAVFDTIGVRIRQPPLRPNRVKAVTTQGAMQH
jgi:hypothetical protein